MGQVKWGILGTSIASRMFAEALNHSDQAKVIAVAANDLQEGEQFSTSFQFDTVYQTYEEILHNSNIDVVFIGTPLSDHEEQIEQCFLANKHVVCNGPISFDADRIKKLLELSKRQALFLIESTGTMCSPVTQQVREWIQMDRIGTIEYMEITLNFDCLDRNIDSQMRGKREELCYLWLYSLSYVNALIEQYPLMVHNLEGILERKDEDKSTVILRYKNDVIITINWARDNKLDTRAVCVGTNGRIEIPNFHQGERACLYDEEDELLELYENKIQVSGYEYEVERVCRFLNDKDEMEYSFHVNDLLGRVRILEFLKNNGYNCIGGLLNAKK